MLTTAKATESRFVSVSVSVSVPVPVPVPGITNRTKAPPMPPYLPVCQTACGSTWERGPLGSPNWPPSDAGTETGTATTTGTGNGSETRTGTGTGLCSALLCVALSSSLLYHRHSCLP